MIYTHIPLSCAIVLGGALVGINPWRPWLAMAALWTGREWTQAEYRWIESLGDGTRASMPWWGGFDPRVWDFKSFTMDMILPALVSGVLAWMLVTYFNKG